MMYGPGMAFVPGRFFILPETKPYKQVKTMPYNTISGLFRAPSLTVKGTIQGLALLPVFVLIACTNGHKRQPQQTAKAGEAVHAKPASGYTDTAVIKGRSAVFFWPGPHQWSQIQTVTDTMVFSSMQHDCFYQQRNARQVLRNYHPGVKIVETGAARLLHFRFNGGGGQWIDLDSLPDACGIFLFDGLQKPKPADMMNIDTELGFYFQRQ
jgi:hypothetical protein